MNLSKKEIREYSARLEVFVNDDRFNAEARELLKEWWDEKLREHRDSCKVIQFPTWRIK